MGGRRRHGLEWLEPRCLLAANLGNIVAVQPYDGESLNPAPQDLVITLDQPFVPFLMGNFDVQLEKVNRDGTTTPIWTVNTAPPEATDATGTELVIPAKEFDPNDGLFDLSLQPGSYEIQLMPGTTFSGYASGAFGPGPQLWDASQPYLLGDFTVLGAGATFGGATNLGTIDSFVPPITGSLNPDNYQSAVDLYQFNLPQTSSLWQVGIAVSAHSIGSGLLPALTLFNQSGEPIATCNSGSGIPSDPDDPYIITGLAPGTYYVGVSGANNLPTASNGYDPIDGDPGSAGIPQPGGPFKFQLGLAAEPHVQASRLVNFTLDRADLTDPSPTGLTLAFSGPIDLSNLFLPDAQETALQVVDSTGRVWPITGNTYQVTDAQLNLIFDQPLPAGRYSLLVPAQGSLTDLAGLPVTAPGEPSGVLATWTVAPSSGLSVADDPGVLWPATANLTNPATNLAAAFSQTTDLAPGQNETFRWVVTVPGFYKVQTQVESGTVAVEDFGNGQPTVLEPGSALPLNNYLMYLNDGVYGLRFINAGSQPAVVQWDLKIASLDWEKIVDNGVSQESALSLMLFSPAPADPDGNAIASFQAISGPAGTSVFSGSSGPLPATLFVTLNTGLMGQPTPGGQNVAPVGPTVEAGSIAVADSTTGLQPGIRYESTSAPGPGDGDQLGEAVPTGAGTVANDQAIRLAAGGAELRLDPEAQSTRADERALAQAEWLGRLGSRIRSWFVPSPSTTDIKPPAAPLVARTMAGNNAAAQPHDAAGFNRNKRLTSSAQVDIGAAASLIMVGAVAYRLRQPLQKWWRRRGRLAAVEQAPAKRFSQGPHPVSTRARATTRTRRVHAAQ